MMIRTLRTAPLAAALAVVFALSALIGAGSAAAAPKTVTDRSSSHNFRLRGPGFNKAITSVGFTGTKTVTVRLRKGTYRYVCDPHSSFMKGSFRVG